MVSSTVLWSTRKSEKVVRRLIKFKGNCCDSCHDDLDNSYGASEIDLGYTKQGDERFAEVCCIVARAFNKWFYESKRNLRTINSI